MKKCKEKARNLKCNLPYCRMVWGEYWAINSLSMVYYDTFQDAMNFCIELKEKQYQKEQKAFEENTNRELNRIVKVNEYEI